MPNKKDIPHAELVLEENRMNNEVEIKRIIKDESFVVTYPKGILKEHEKRILAEGVLGDLLKMRFISSEKQDSVYYEIAGYISLAQVIFNNLNEAMDIIEGVLTAMLKAEDYLIDIGNICLDYRWVYYNKINNDIRLAYVPRREVLQWQLSIFQLVGDLNGMYDSKEAQPYFEELKKYMEECPRNLQDLFLKICDLKREAHLAGATK